MQKQTEQGSTACRNYTMSFRNQNKRMLSVTRTCNMDIREADVMQTACMQTIHQENMSVQ